MKKFYIIIKKIAIRKVDSIIELTRNCNQTIVKRFRKNYREDSFEIRNSETDRG